jgi:hypothetical protein
LIREIIPSTEKNSQHTQPPESEVWDILIALKKLPVTIEILRETKIGNTVYETRKKYPTGHKSHNEAKVIIALWKKACDKPSTDVSDKPKIEAKIEIVKEEKVVDKVTTDEETIIRQDSADEEEHHEVEKNYDSLSSTRRKVRDTERWGLG